MFGELKLSAISVAFVVSFALPFGVLYVTPIVLGLASGQRSGDVPTAVVLLWFLCAVLSPILAGYIAARLARQQPLLHAHRTRHCARDSRGSSERPHWIVLLGSPFYSGTLK